MTTLSDAQIAAVARGAGFPASAIAIAVAVCLAESGGRTDAVNTANRDGTRDYGLWQINSVHGALLSSGSWSSPTDNARMAHTVWADAGGRWTPWSTYNNGAYLPFLVRGRAAASSGGASTISNPIDLPGDHIPNGPYDPNTLHPPLTVEQRSRILAWYKLVTVINAGHISGLEPFDKISKLPDADLLRYYTGIYILVKAGNTPITGPPNPLDAASDIIHALGKLIDFISNPHNWLRAGEIVVGGALVLMALYQVAGISLPNPASAAIKAVA